MGFKVEINCTGITAPDGLTIPVARLNVFLPKSLSVFEKSDVKAKVTCFLELHIMGIKKLETISRIKFTSNQITNDAKKKVTATCCSDLFFEKDSPAAEYKYKKLLNEKVDYTLGGGHYIIKKLDDQIIIPIHLTLDDNEYAGSVSVFNKDGKPISITDGSISAISADKKALAVWIKWEEAIPKSHPWFAGRSSVFEHKIDITYEGISINYAKSDEVVPGVFFMGVSLPEGCQDNSMNFTEPKSKIDSTYKVVSSWKEMKERTSADSSLFEEWKKTHDMNNRRFVYYETKNSQEIKNIKDAEFSLNISDNHGRVRQQAELAIIGVVFGAVASIIITKSQAIIGTFSAIDILIDSLRINYLTGYEPITNWKIKDDIFKNFSHGIAFLILYSLAVFIGALFVSWRIHGNKWFNKDWVIVKSFFRKGMAHGLESGYKCLLNPLYYLQYVSPIIRVTAIMLILSIASVYFADQIKDTPKSPIATTDKAVLQDNE